MKIQVVGGFAKGRKSLEPLIEFDEEAPVHVFKCNGTTFAAQCFYDGI